MWIIMKCLVGNHAFIITQTKLMILNFKSDGALHCLLPLVSNCLGRSQIVLHLSINVHNCPQYSNAHPRSPIICYKAFLAAKWQVVSQGHPPPCRPIPGCPGTCCAIPRCHLPGRVGLRPSAPAPGGRLSYLTPAASKSALISLIKSFLQHIS